MIIELHGFDRFGSNLSRSREYALLALQSALRGVQRLLVPSKGRGPMADATPIGRRPRSKRVVGDPLARSTVGQIIGKTEDMRLEIRQGARVKSVRRGLVYYGRFVRGGTQGGMRVSSAGKLFFHPGSRANPYHLRVMNAQKGNIERILAKEGVDLVAKLADI